MGYIIKAIGLLVLLFVLRDTYRFIRNYIQARKTGFTIVLLPIDTDNPLWLILTGMYHGTARKYLPSWLYDRLILGVPLRWEMEQKRLQFVRLQTKTIIVVTTNLNTILTADPEFIAEDLRRIKDFTQPPMMCAVIDMFGPSLLSSEGESWSRQRKLVTTIINERTSRSVWDESCRQAGFLIDDLLATAGAGSGTQALDGMSRIAINVLSRVGYGIPQAWEDSAATAHAAAWGATPEPRFMDAITTVCDHILLSALLPTTLLVRWPAWLPGRKLMGQIGHAVRAFPVLAQQRIEEERQLMASEADAAVARSSLLSQLVQNSDQQADGHGKGGAPLTVPEMHGKLFIFTAAGLDTTSKLLQSAWVVLAVRPDLQSWLGEEIDALLPPGSPPAHDYAAVYPKALRTQALMLEVLRLFPPIPHNSKANQTRAWLPVATADGPRLVPPAAVVYNSAVLVHTDPRVWRDLKTPNNEKEAEEETLADAREMRRDEYVFRPQRWLGPNGMFKPPAGSFIAFSAGPRVCPGQKMAQVEFVGVVMSVLRRLRVEAVRQGEGETEDAVRERYWGIANDVILEVTSTMKRRGEADLRWSPREGI